MLSPHDFKAVRLYREGMSVKGIVCHMGCTKSRVLRHLQLAGIELDPTRESSHHGHVTPEHLIGVDGISADSAKFLSKNQPQSHEQEEQFNREIAEACERIRPRSIAKRLREASHA